MAALLGRAPAEIVGAPLVAYLERGQPELAIAAPIRDRRVRFVDAGGQAIELEVNGSPVRDATGTVAGFVMVARDDRALRAIEAQLVIADRLASVGTVAAGVAHEINNPLAFVIGNLEYIAEELALPELDIQQLPELRKALAATIDGAHRVKHIVRDLKSFARSDGDTSIPIDINALADTALSMVRNELRHHARVVKAYGKVPRVIGNEGRLVQVLVNLLQNAAHAIPAGDAETNSVTIATGMTASGAATIEVRDTGSGIPPDVAARVFDPFFTTKPIGVGTGLGLAICQKLVTGLGGRIEFDTAVGKGTTFRIVLPAASAEDLATEPMPRMSRPARRLRILAIDDEPEIGAALQRNLGRDHDVVFVTRAAAALELIAGGRFDVVLCDVMMPEMTGVQFLDRLAATQPAIAARVVFMTGGAFSPAARELLESTNNERVDKPFDFAVVRATLAKLTG
jgi:signal transduction histidine kinase